MRSVKINGSCLDVSPDSKDRYDNTHVFGRGPQKHSTHAYYVGRLKNKFDKAEWWFLQHLPEDLKQR
jgi:hypothetical protein